MGQQQQIATDCPDWTTGVLDVPLQWGREHIAGWDWWLILSAILGGVILLVVFPLTRQLISTAVDTIKIVWTKTKRKTDG